MGFARMPPSVPNYTAFAPRPPAKSLLTKSKLKQTQISLPAIQSKDMDITFHIAWAGKGGWLRGMKFCKSCSPQAGLFDADSGEIMGIWESDRLNASEK
jgi:hypothetical protein